MNMNQEIADLESYTVEEFQTNFDELIERVQNGESFLIKSEYGEAVIVPYKEVIQVFENCEVDEDLIRIHTNHEEGS